MELMGVCGLRPEGSINKNIHDCIILLIDAIVNVLIYEFVNVEEKSPRRMGIGAVRYVCE